MSVERRREIEGSQEEAGRPSPLMKIIKLIFLWVSGAVPGKNVYAIGASGLLGIVRKVGGVEDIVMGVYYPAVRFKDNVPTKCEKSKVSLN